MRYFLCAAKDLPNYGKLFAKLTLLSDFQVIMCGTATFATGKLLARKEVGNPCIQAKLHLNKANSCSPVTALLSKATRNSNICNLHHHSRDILNTLARRSSRKSLAVLSVKLPLSYFTLWRQRSHATDNYKFTLLFFSYTRHCRPLHFIITPCQHPLCYHM